MQPNDSDYNFILNDTNTRNGGPSFLQDPKKRNIFAALFVAVVLLLVFIVVSFFLSAGKTDVNALRSVAAQQNKLIDLTSAGLENARDPSTRSNIAVLQAFLLSDLAETRSLFGSAASENLLLGTYDPAIDTQLERAAQRNQYDVVLQENIDELVAEYKSRLNTSITTYQTSTRILPVLELAATNILTYQPSVDPVQ